MSKHLAVDTVEPKQESDWDVVFPMEGALCVDVWAELWQTGVSRAAQYGMLALIGMGLIGLHMVSLGNGVYGLGRLVLTSNGAGEVARMEPGDAPAAADGLIPHAITINPDRPGHANDPTNT